MYLQENFIKKLGARQCDCWGEGGIMGLNGNGKNTIKVKFLKKIKKEEIKIRKLLNNFMFWYSKCNIC